MNQLFTARNKLREYSFQKFAEYLEKSKNNLTSIDYINLLQQSFSLHKKQFIDYIRLFHKYFHDIVFSELGNEKNKLTVLEEILRYGKAWQLEELIKIDHRIVKDFNLKAINCAIDNASNSKDSKSGFDIVKILIDKKPDIILDPVYDYRDNPLLESLHNQLYDISSLLLERQCYILPSKNYTSNQLHYLFKNRLSKKNQTKILQIARQLINNKVDIYQKNENGKTALQLCNSDIKDQIQKIYKFSFPKNYHNVGHSNSGSMKNNQKHKNRNNQKSDNNNKYNDNINNLNDNLRTGRLQKGGNMSSSTKNIYKGSKVKSQFGGKQIIKENNELVRINIQNNNLSHKDSNSNIPDSSIVKILNLEQIENQASLIFQKHTQKKEDNFANQRGEYQKEEKTNKQKRTKVIQTQQLKYYLKEQIKTLTEKIRKQNSQQNQKFQKLFDQIKCRIQEIIPEIQVQLFGSFATYLHLDESDIDIVIVSKKIKENKNKYLPSDQIHEIFKRVHGELVCMSQFIKQAVFLDKASVPIIKATCSAQYKYKNVDISFQDELHNGVKSVELIKKYLNIYPQLNKLMIVLKKFIYQSKLFAPYSGGLSSYGLFLMIVAFLQNQETNNNGVDRIKNPKQDIIDLRVAELLINFLKFYGFRLDYVTQKIEVSLPEQILNGIYLKNYNFNSQWQNQFSNFLPNLNWQQWIPYANRIMLENQLVVQNRFVWPLNQPLYQSTLRKDAKIKKNVNHTNEQKELKQRQGLGKTKDHAAFQRECLGQPITLNFMSIDFFSIIYYILWFPDKFNSYLSILKSWLNFERFMQQRKNHKMLIRLLILY